MTNKPCPFCSFDIETELFYHDKWSNIIICRDKQDKHRLLAIRTSLQNHKQIPDLKEREELMIPLIAVTEAYIRNGKATGYTVDEIVKSDHYHYYANLS